MSWMAGQILLDSQPCPPLLYHGFVGDVFVQELLAVESNGVANAKIKAMGPSTLQCELANVGGSWVAGSTGLDLTAPAGEAQPFQLRITVLARAPGLALRDRVNIFLESPQATGL